jgi:Spy/CpxP family protein refolding chaperone
MNTKAVLIAAASGFSVAAAGVAAVYFCLRQTRKGSAGIKGYLDLIPDLSPGQRAEVEEIRRVFLPKVEALRRSMRSHRAELADLLFDAAADRAKIDAVAERIIGHQAELERAVVDHILEEKALLTPSQQRRFHAIITTQFSSGGLGVHDFRKQEPQVSRRG